MTNIVTQSKEVTMTSLELVEYINSERQSERALRHDHFMVKVPKVLGENTAPKFRGSYLAKDGSTRPCYNLPKREACLMAMSYSYDLQAKVFDKMTELEQKQTAPTPAPQVRDARTAALIDALVRQDALEQEQQRQSVELTALKHTMAVVEARTQPENEYFTLAGYARLKGIKFDMSSIGSMGKRCTSMSKQQGLMVGQVNDPRWGYVNTYHESIIQAILNH